MSAAVVLVVSVVLTSVVSVVVVSVTSVVVVDKPHCCYSSNRGVDNDIPGLLYSVLSFLEISSKVSNL